MWLASKALALLAILLLSSCAHPPGRQNPGAQFHYDILTDADMSVACAKVKRESSDVAWLIMGACLSDRIVERYAGSEVWVFPHEAAHLADRLGSYRAAITALTPPNPTPYMAKRLALLREIDAAGPDYWATIYRRYGREAIGGHTHILRRLEP